MTHRQLPPNLQDRVRRFVQYNWLSTRGVKEEEILQALPLDLRREIQKHLCLDLVRRVSNHQCLRYIFLFRIQNIYFFIHPGPFLLENGQHTPGRDMPASGVIPKHKRHVHRPRRRSRKRDVLHNQRASRKFYNRRWTVRILQLNHPQTRGFLRRRAADVGPDEHVKPKPSGFYPDGQVQHRSGSIRPSGRRPQILCQPV